MRRPCLDCGTLVPSPASRCALHQANLDARRGTTGQRGYGPDHARLRGQWLPKVNAGLVDCARCHRPIVPGEKWHLDHADDRTGYIGPSHATCNDRAAGRKGRA